jgi:gamma-glutamyl-gamma-aminobutyrate hydrolase PuuD
MKTIYSGIFGGNVHPFNHLLDDEGVIEIAREPDDLKDATGALIIWGGADINPEFYNHPMHRTTRPGGERDRMEWSLMTRAVEMGMAIIGVCRGAQMLCAKAGGWLIQDVGTAHLGNHWTKTKDGDFFITNSIHHQMMAGLGTVDHELVAWSDKRLADHYGYMDNKAYEPGPDWKEPEFVYFPKIRGYAIQWHPEGMGIQTPANQYILKYIANKEKELNEYRRTVCSC